MKGKYEFWSKRDHLAYFKSKDPRPVIEDKWKFIRDMGKDVLSNEGLLRLEWIIFYNTIGKKNVTVTAGHFGISRKTLHKWINRFKENNLKTLESQSKRPKRKRNWEVTLLEEARIHKLRKQYMKLGKMKLQQLYIRRYGGYVSAWKIQRVIERNNLYLDVPTTLKRRKRSKTKKKRIQELQPKKQTGFLLHLDTIVLYYNNVRRYIITAIDDTSRIAYARVYKSISSKSAEDFLHR